MKALRQIIRFMLGSCRVLGWLAETLWLGAVATWHIGMVVVRWREVFAETIRCPRDHEVPMYGVFECRCGSLIEDWVFARCRVCGQSAGWTPCTTCGLPIRNPLIV